MSDYRRWISYIYAYENGVKKRNAGYAKLELKDGKLTMTLHVTPDNRAGDYRVCLYKSQAGHREGVLLGHLEKGQGGEGTRFLEDASDLCGSGLLFQEMNGLLLYDDRGKYLISSWEDEPVEISVMQEIAALLEKGQEDKAAKGNGKQGVEAGKGTNVLDTTENRKAQASPAEGTMTGKREENQKAAPAPEEAAKDRNQTENWKTKPAPEEAAKDRNQAENWKTKPAHEEDTKDGYQAENGITKPIKEAEMNDTGKAEPPGTKLAREEGMQDGDGQQKVKKQPSPEPKIDDGNTGRTKMPEPAPKPTPALHAESVAESNRPSKTEDMPKERKISPLESRVFSCLPAMYPFEHQEFERSVRMEPQDLGLLPREMWKYAGNSFLLHSYYAYHHMLFVRKMRGRERNCYLMLPGVFDPKEQHMAQLFGFSKFCPVRKKPLQQGDFGYWYMEVRFPEAKSRA